MAKQINLSINNKLVSVAENTLIINAAKQAGIDIPVFCYHPKLQSVGMCRVCLVEVGRPVMDRATGTAVLEADGTTKIQFGPKLETACTTPVSEGMIVRSESEKAKAARNEILEFLLTSHPLDCPVCDKGGECPLQNLTLRYGPGKSRFLFEDKQHLSKKVPLGELIYLDRERCIQCGRCVRFQDDLADDPVISFFQRGRSIQIITRSDPGFDSIFSGNTTDICPVGALTTADFRFGARPWEMKAYASVCPHCPVGCNLSIDIRREAKSDGRMVIKRIMPRQNEEVNSLWICDKGRFGYHFADLNERILKPMIRKEGELKSVSLEAALDLAATRMRGKAKRIVTLVGGRLANEDLFNLKALTEKLSGKTFLYGAQDGGEVSRHLGIGPDMDLTNINKETVILVIASDLHEEAPLYWFWVQQAVKRGASLVVINPRTTRLDKNATHSLHYRYGEEGRVLHQVASSLDRNDSPIAKLIHKTENLLIFVGQDGLGLRTSRIAYENAARLLETSGRAYASGSGLVIVGQSANTQGAWELGLSPAIDLAKAIQGVDVLLVAGADPLGDHPELEPAIRSVKTLILLELLHTPTAEQADIVIPVQALTERQGTYTSAARRVQLFQKALSTQGDIHPDYTIAALLGKKLGISLAEDAEGVFGKLADSIPVYKGLSYSALNRVDDQWPVTGGRSKYFSGTVSKNCTGMGIQLPVLPREQKTTRKSDRIKDRSLDREKLWGVPITRLYDIGNTLRPSKLLEKRMAAFMVIVHPMTASEQGISAGAVNLSMNGKSELVRCILDETVPEGFALIPRSSGIPIDEPYSIRLTSIIDQKHIKGSGQK